MGNQDHWRNLAIVADGGRSSVPKSGDNMGGTRGSFPGQNKEGRSLSAGGLSQCTPQPSCVQ